MPLDALDFDPKSLEPWDFSRKDWVERIRERKSLLPDLPFLNRERAENARQIFRSLVLPDVPGQPYFGDVGAPWMEDIAATIHGCIVDTPDGKMIRMAQKAFILTPKKQGKTGLGSAIALTEFILNARPRAKFILVGATQKIADTAFDNIKGMIEADPFLYGTGGKRGLMHITATHKLVTNRANKATLQVLTFDTKVLTGVKPAFILFDELHLTTSMPNAGKILLQLIGGMVSQPEACCVFITTQSDKPPAGTFKGELALARGVRDGTITDAPILPILYELPPEALVETEPGEEKWRDIKFWPMVMPNLGYSVQLDRMIQEFKNEENKGREDALVWATQHLNLELGTSQSSTSWTAGIFWSAAGKEKGLTLRQMMRRCDIIVPGIDGGGLDDLFGFCALGRIKGTERWLAWFHAWAHTIVRQRRKEIVQNLEDFEAEGDLTFVEDLEVAYDEVVSILSMINGAGLLGHVAVDRAGLNMLPPKMDKAGIKRKFFAGQQEWERMAGIHQGVFLMGSIKVAEVKIQNKTILHDGGSLMSWCVGNARTVLRGNASLIDKEVSGKSKIDPLMALFNAVSVLSTNPPSPKTLLKAHGLETIDL